jgi:hypothetical protein
MLDLVGVQVVVGIWDLETIWVLVEWAGEIHMDLILGLMTLGTDFITPIFTIHLHLIMVLDTIHGVLVMDTTLGLVTIIAGIVIVGEIIIALLVGTPEEILFKILQDLAQEVKVLEEVHQALVRVV